MENKEYASKGVAGTALGIGIGALGLTALNGGLGNLLGGWNGNGRGYVQTPDGKISQLESEIAFLKSENYSDKVAKEVYMQSVADNNALSTQVFNYINPMAQTIANNAVEMARMDERIKCLTRTVDGVTKVVIPNSNVCPGWGNVTITPATTTTTTG